MPSLTRQMADFVLNLRYEDIPALSVKEAKRFLLDSLGCALAAVGNDDVKAMERFTAKLGGTPEATVIGSGLRTNAPNAALMNSLLVRALDYNDIFWEQDPSHPSDIIFGALSPAEAEGRDGREALAAIIIAYELELRWCLACFPGVREVGWHHATLTQLVSPFVAGRIYGLDADQLVAAAGISGSSHYTLGGVVAGHLTNMKNTADPLATQAGVLAALMAREGYEGPVEVIEGKEGFRHVLHNVELKPEILLQGLGEDFLITRCAYKPFPTEALTHQPLSAVQMAMQQNGLVAEDLAGIHVQTTTRGADILSDPSKYDPQTKETADHSLPYCVAAVAADGGVYPHSFDQEKLFNPRIRALLPKIKVVANAEIDALFPGTKRAIATLTTTDGRTFTETVDHAKGSPANPMSDDELVAKFRANAHGKVDGARQDAIIEAVWGFDRCGDLREFMQLLVV
ncbi:MmgE/PrpD family protein [bacterium CG_4_9_14_3_um_filter_65_15]|nr:MAG: MmgE/PrpD family protein [bacterium CG_4_9_14_3_um_filter_65_15]